MPDLTAIVAILDRAASKLKYPKIRLETPTGRLVVLSRAGSKARFPGSVTVTNGEPYGSYNSYFGSIKRTGESSINDQEVVALLAAFAEAPAEVSARYGKATGNCCFCQTRLTNSKAGSAEIGYGPVCARNFGLPWSPNGKSWSLTEGNKVAVLA